MSKPLDRLTLLHTFTRIAESGSLSAAARDLGLSQPSVSRQLAELEERLQSQLVRRNTHSLALTEAGLELLRDARQLLDHWQSIEEKHHRGDNAIQGRLKVVAPMALGQMHLVDIALGFQSAYPGVNLSWQLDDGAIRFTEVGCDCWIKVGPVADDSLIVKTLGFVERMLVAAPSLLARYTSAKKPNDAEKMPCIALTPFEGERIPLSNRRGDTAVISPPVQMTTNNIFALHRAALLGLGMAVLPRWFVDEDLVRGKLVDVLPKWRAPRLPVHIAYAPGRHQPQRLRLFLDAVYQEFNTIPGITRDSDG